MKIGIKTNTSPLSGHTSHEVFFGNRLRGYQSGNIAVGLQHSFELRNHQTLPKKEVPFYTCKEFRALTLNVYFRAANSVNGSRNFPRGILGGGPRRRSLPRRYSTALVFYSTRNFQLPRHFLIIHEQKRYSTIVQSLHFIKISRNKAKKDLKVLFI